MFVNFQFYVIQGGTDNNYIMLFAVLSAVFLAFLLSLYFLTGMVFERTKKESLGGTMRIVIRILSVLMCLFMFLLQIPMITLML